MLRLSPWPLASTLTEAPGLNYVHRYCPGPYARNASYATGDSGLPNMTNVIYHRRNSRTSLAVPKQISFIMLEDAQAKGKRRTSVVGDTLYVLRMQ